MQIIENTFPPGLKPVVSYQAFAARLKPCHDTVRFLKCTLLVGGGGDFALPVGGFEEFAGTGAVGGADQAVVFHHVDEVGGSAVTDSEAALQ